MDIETLWYEFSPYVYAIAGVVSILNLKSGLSIVSGVLLLGASATILRLRWVHRRKMDQKIDRAL
jgi:hypothetical protein